MQLTNEKTAKHCLSSTTHIKTKIFLMEKFYLIKFCFFLKMKLMKDVNRKTI